MTDKIYNGIIYTDTSIDYYYGQLNKVITATKDDKVVGTLEYSEYEDVPHVQMVYVSEDFRRQGIATKMFQFLQEIYPNKEIVLGQLTNDGSNLIKNIFYEVPNKTKEKIRYDNLLKQKEKLKNQLQAYQIELDKFYDTEESQITNSYREYAMGIGDRWNMVNDKLKDIERQLVDLQFHNNVSDTQMFVKGTF